MRGPFLQAIRAVCLLAIVILSHTAAWAEENPTAEPSFSVVLLPDTQYYSEKYSDTYVAQALWIRQQAKQDNIKFVVHLGDIVQTSTQQPQWENADRALRLLDGVVPYSMARGNHDMDVNDFEPSGMKFMNLNLEFAPRDETLTDYEGLPNGGDGWLRSLQFVPSENKIYIKNYSPLLDKHNDDETETCSLDYDMTATKRTSG